MTALETFIRAARRNPARQKQIVYKKQEPRFIDATDRVEEIKEKRQAESGKWEKCTHLKLSGGRHSCRKFMSLCCKSKCDPRHIEPVAIVEPGKKEKN